MKYLTAAIFSLFSCGLLLDGKETFIQQVKEEKITLYYAPSCPYSVRVLNYLKKIGRTVPLKNVKENAAYKEELKKAGGILQVPCLVVNGTAIYGDDEIINWLSQHKEELDLHS